MGRGRDVGGRGGCDGRCRTDVAGAAPDTLAPCDRGPRRPEDAGSDVAGGGATAMSSTEELS